MPVANEGFYIPPHYRLNIYDDRVEILSFSHVKKGRKLNPWKGSTGYPYVTINGEKTAMHALVSRMVFGKRPPGYQINHKDANKENYHPSNLEYVTPKQNIRHAMGLGLHPARFPRSMHTYKDGRCSDNPTEYYRKKNLAWHYANRETSNLRRKRNHAKAKKRLAACA